ncbi:MAG: hypothetical protein FJ026_12135, partial [Chloroflexi bacterium]|nr:hypothetical protein [Chloroflexota bacterium]
MRNKAMAALVHSVGHSWAKPGLEETDMLEQTSGETSNKARVGEQQTTRHALPLCAKTRRIVCCRSAAMSRPWSRLLLAVLLLGQLCLACAGPLTPTVSPSRTPTTLPSAGNGTGLTYVQTVRSASTGGSEGGMRFALSAGSPMPVLPERVPAGQTTPLSAEQTQTVLRRLPPLEEEASDQQEFRLPAQTLPAPRPGETIQQVFPPQESATPGEQPAVGP